MKVAEFSLRGSLELTLEKHKIQENAKAGSLRAEILSALTKEFISWCPEGRVLPVGSYRLSVHSPDSDIDIICVAPQNYSRQSFQEEFLSNLESMSGVTYVYGVFRAKVPLIKLIIHEIRIDLQFANTDQELDALEIYYLDEASLLSINAYRNNELILSLVPDMENFRFLLRVIRLWAKKRNLYSSVLGYLGGVSWSILSAKICIQFPVLSAIELVHMFFKVYATWDWAMPIHINPEESSYISYSQQGFMNILTPARPSYNSAYTLTASSFTVIQQELQLACKIVNDVIEGNQAWQALFKEINFFQQYRYFIKVAIQASSNNELETWTGIIFSRTKFLLQELECYYPRPNVLFYNKPFEAHYKGFKASVNYYIGVNFNFPSSVKVDFRMPILNFSSALKELRPNKNSMGMRMAFVTRKELMQNYVREI